MNIITFLDFFYKQNYFMQWAVKLKMPSAGITEKVGATE
jgi:hypothetical protein